jgi:hypothetical protein
VTDLAQKRPLARTLNAFAQRKVLDAIATLGRALPCTVVAVSGSIVTVSFEIASDYTLPTVTMPVATWQWARPPIQIGDQGMTVPADVDLGGISGLGAGIAGLSLPANLSALVFMPVASANWSASENPNAWVIYGPDGVILRDSGNACSLTLTPSGVAIKGDLTVTGNVTAAFGGAFVDLLHHIHTGVTAGTDDSGVPVTHT